MPTQQSTVDDLLILLAVAGEVTARKMFGEYCVYLNQKPIALVCDDRFYLKPTAIGRELIPDAEEGSPYPGAKPHLLIPDAVWHDSKLLKPLIQSTYQQLPAPKPKKKKN